MVISDRAARMALSRIVDAGDPELSAVVEPSTAALLEPLRSEHLFE